MSWRCWPEGSASNSSLQPASDGWSSPMVLPVVLPVTFILDEDAVVFAPEPTRSSRPRRAVLSWPSKSTTSNRLYASAGASASVGRQQPVQCPTY